MWRHKVMSVASIVVLTSCLLILGVFWVLRVNLNVNLENLQMLNEIVVFCDNDLSQDQVDALASDIRAMDNVKYIEYTSKAAGLEKMRETYSDHAGLFDQMIEKGDNPLSDSFTITYKDNTKVYELEYSLRQMCGIKSVSNRSDYAQKVETFKNGLSAVFLWLLILLFAVSMFVIFNTIKLTVHGRKNEIEIMRYIGATKGFIIAPFLLEGGIIGLFSGAVSFFAVYGMYGYALKTIASDLEMLVFVPFEGSLWLMLPAFILIGIICGFAASYLSLHKSLKR